MANPARTQWWDDVVKVDTVKLNDFTHLLWGDRVRILEPENSAGLVKVSARGSTGMIPASALGGEPLLEVYFIDVGQGDGILVVTPEGHHLLVDGGLPRSRQDAGKSAADFVDWKFHDDYLSAHELSDNDKNQVRIDAMISSHADLDHYGGLRDLIDPTIEAKADELETVGTTVEAFYHQGLCPQKTGTDELGPKTNGHFTKLLGDRDSAVAGVSDNPGNEPDIRGEYKKFINNVIALKNKAGDPTPITRLSHKSDFLPGFAPTDNGSEVTIHVLAPIEKTEGGGPALRDIGDEGENKNGHSIALRLDYRDRRILLTGDLNDKSQKDIIAHYGDDFAETWRSDVAKACHHGSHHVLFDFLKGVNALSTVFSSGDSNTFDHPRAWVLGAAALSGRVIEGKKGRLTAPLIYSTEVARSIALKDVEQLRRYATKQEFGKPDDAELDKISGPKTIEKWRLVLEGDDKTGYDFPPLWGAKAMHHLIYGLVNVRTDGKRLLFAVRNEGNSTWARETMEAEDIDKAYTLEKPKPSTGGEPDPT